MKALILVPAILLCSLVYAAEPTDSSVRELLALSEARKPLDALMSETESSLATGMRQKLFRHDMTAEEQIIIDNGIKQMIDAIRSEMQWEKLEGERISIYKRAFSQSEIDGMIAFYRTAAGKAVIEKMPLVKQEDLKISLNGYGKAFERLEKIERDIMASLQSANR